MFWKKRYIQHTTKKSSSSLSIEYLEDPEMKTAVPLLVAMLSIGKVSFAADYIVDFTRIQDFESMRSLVESCGDFGAMELYKDKMKSSENLEDMRSLFVEIGFGMFNECPDSISGSGISPVK